MYGHPVSRCYIRAMEYLSWAQAGAVIMACWAIISGIGAWKREFIGKRQIELAELVLAKFFEARDAIAMIRSPIARSTEGNSRKRADHESPEATQLLDRAFVAYERYLTKESVFNDLATLKYRFMASFGAESEQIFKDTAMVINSILVSAQVLGSHYWPRQGRVAMTPEENQVHLDGMWENEKIFWDHGKEDDDIRAMLAAIEKELGKTVAPCFREPMDTYTWLTSPWKRPGKKPSVISA